MQIASRDAKSSSVRSKRRDRRDGQSFYPEVQARLIERYESKLTEVGIKYDERRLKEIVGIYYPDLRSIANQVEYDFA
jgi:hypothetical protein